MRLGTVCTKVGSGATPLGGSRVYSREGPYALIRSQNIFNDGFHAAGLAFINEEQAAKLSNVEVLPGDVLLNITGDSVARACQVDDSILPARVNQHVAIIRPDGKRLDAGFLRYVLISPEIQKKLLSWAGSGGTRSALTKQMIESLDLVLPTNIEEQKRIARAIGALDEKIRLNRRMNDVIDDLALAEFERRFSAVHGTTTLNELMEVCREVVDPRLSPTDQFDHYSLPAYDDGKLPKRQVGAEIGSAKFAVQDGALLVSKLNPSIARVWLPLPEQPSARRIASTEFMVLTPVPPASAAFLYTFWRSARVRDLLTSRVTGTSGSHQRVRALDVLQAIAPTGSVDEITQFSVIAEPLYGRYVSNLREIQTLLALRNALLTELVSGRVRIASGQQ